MEWLLTDKEIEQSVLTDLFEDDIDKRITKAQLSYVVKKLMEPCTEHPQFAKPELNIRWDCPICRKELKQEAGIE